MAQTFDIRFSRSAGIAALFAAAGNTFGWKGQGRISIGAQGIDVAAKRGIGSLLARSRSRRIAAENIRQVYREGEALRVEFSTDDDPRGTLPFWVRDPDTAARIVALLPTTRTVELEDSLPDSRDRRGTRHEPLLWAATLAMIVGIFFTLYQRAVLPSPRVADASTAPAQPPAVPTDATVATPAAQASDDGAGESTPAPSVEASPPATSIEPSPPEPVSSTVRRATDPVRYTTPEEARKLAMLAEDPIDWTSPPPASRAAAAEAMAREARMNPLGVGSEREVEAFVPMDLPELRIPAMVVPIPQTSLAYDAARGLLRDFEAAAHELDERYRDERGHFDGGSMEARTFANRLDALEIRWRGLGDGMLSDRKYADPALTGLRATLAYVVIQQRAFLSGYGAGLRTGNQEGIDRAFQELARAVEAMTRARTYLD